MVAKVKEGKSIRDTFFYNENKVKDGVATCLMAENYPWPLEQLTEHYRLKMLEKQAALNTTTEVNSVHISLNFDPSEKLSQETLKDIAKQYMNKIGFGHQPYLVYEHRDAGHPHLHVVTTNIELDGQAISLHRMGMRKSEPARKELEKAFNLVRAEDQKLNGYKLKPVHVGKVIYGRSESRRAMANVLSKVLPEYRYTSLHSLNALLGLYNIMADRGTENSRVFQNNGLLYRILDNDGQSVGVPIKASAFFEKPTLIYLEKRFIANKADAAKHKTSLKNAIDFAIMKHKGIDLKSLIDVLHKGGIDVVLRQNNQGILYGITYVDHKSKYVFNGSELGKAYSAKAILERTSQQPILKTEIKEQTNLITNPQEKPDNQQQPDKANYHNNAPSQSQDYVEPDSEKGLLELLMQAEYAGNYLPYELRRKPKRRKKRKLNN